MNMKHVFYGACIGALIAVAGFVGYNKFGKREAVDSSSIADQIVVLEYKVKEVANALQKKPDYLNVLNVAELQHLIQAIKENNALTGDQREFLVGRVRRVHKDFLDLLDSLLELEPDMELYTGQEVEASN